MERNADDRTITLHDLLHSYTREKLGDRYVQTHRDFLDSYGVEEWYKLPLNERYIWSELAHHLIEAKRSGEFLKLLVDSPDWLTAKSKNLGYAAGMKDLTQMLQLAQESRAFIPMIQIHTAVHFLRSLAAKYRVPEDLQSIPDNNIKNLVQTISLWPNPHNRFHTLLSVALQIDSNGSDYDEILEILLQPLCPYRSIQQRGRYVLPIYLAVQYFSMSMEIMQMQLLHSSKLLEIKNPTLYRVYIIS
ncbi:hypothetical protein HC928_21260 [bacterium]|nr:hypothetical protein [bacterium]